MKQKVACNGIDCNCHGRVIAVSPDLANSEQVESEREIMILQSEVEDSKRALLNEEQFKHEKFFEVQALVNEGSIS
jgi:hypothetical protein